MFLALYLNGKLKPFAYRPGEGNGPFWKLVIIALPLLFATLLAGAKCVDEYHNWYDVLAGAIIGTFFAFFAYRMVYAAIWNPELNGKPLMPPEE